MMLTTRLLPPDEWDKLKGTELETLTPILVPEHTRIIVVEDEQGKVVGCWSLLQFTHAEGLWIAPEHRNGSGVFRRLLIRAKEELAEMHESIVWTGAVSESVEKMLVRAGAVPVPGTHYLLSSGGEPCPQQQG